MIEIPDSGQLSCDDCGKIVDVDLTEFAGQPSSVGFDFENNAPDGWVEINEDTHYCPDCADEEY